MRSRRALTNGAGAIGGARASLLAKADQVDAGPLSVSDQWVVLVDPVRMSAEAMAELQALAMEEQGVVNTLLIAVGDADDATANAIAAAGRANGLVEPTRPSDLGGMMMPPAPSPSDQVPDPRTPIGTQAQEALRAANEQEAVREVVESRTSSAKR